jgi:hypothetical protein
MQKLTREEWEALPLRVQILYARERWSCALSQTAQKRWAAVLRRLELRLREEEM